MENILNKITIYLNYKLQIKRLNDKNINEKGSIFLEFALFSFFLFSLLTIFVEASMNLNKVQIINLKEFSSKWQQMDKEYERFR